MALQANVTLSTNSVTAGQPAYATLTVYNPNAVAVSVTGAVMNSRAQGDTAINRTTINPSIVPVGPGMGSTIAALSSANFGPFPIVAQQSGSANAFQSVTQTGNTSPLNLQPSQPPIQTYVIGADVFGSDGSTNAAGIATLIVSPTVSGLPGAQGGTLAMSVPTNLITFLLVL